MAGKKWYLVVLKKPDLGPFTKNDELIPIPILCQKMGINSHSHSRIENGSISIPIHEWKWELTHFQFIILATFPSFINLFGLVGVNVGQQAGELAYVLICYW